MIWSTLYEYISKAEWWCVQVFQHDKYSSSYALFSAEQFSKGHREGKFVLYFSTERYGATGQQNSVDLKSIGSYTLAHLQCRKTHMCWFKNRNVHWKISYNSLTSANLSSLLIILEEKFWKTLHMRRICFHYGCHRQNLHIQIRRSL